MVKIGNEIKMARINPNTGAIRCIGTETFSNLHGGINSAVSCAANTYIFGDKSNGIDTYKVMDLNIGSVLNSFTCSVMGLTYNNLDGKYYGAEGNFNSAKLISLNPTTGLLTTLSAQIQWLWMGMYGSTLNANNGTYLSLISPQSSGSSSIASIPCNGGSYTMSPSLNTAISNSINNTPEGWAYCQSLNKLYAMAFQLGSINIDQRFSEINITTGSVTPIGPVFFSRGMFCDPTACGGATIDEQSKTYSFINGINELVNINILTGVITSSIALQTAETYFIKYLCNSNPQAGFNCSSVTGINETEPSINIKPIYYDFYGNVIEPIPGILMIKQIGNSRKKVLILE